MTHSNYIQGLQPRCLAMVITLVSSFGIALSTGFRYNDNDEIKWSKNKNFS
jgi:hypothetical protein